MRNSKYQIVRHGKIEWRLNEVRAKARGLALKEIAEIRRIQNKKLKVFNKMRKLNSKINRPFLIALDRQLELYDFELQRLWREPQDASRHRYWERPHCTCAKSLNQKYRVGCPLHSVKINFFQKDEPDLSKRELPTDSYFNWLFCLQLLFILVGLISGALGIILYNIG